MGLQLSVKNCLESVFIRYLKWCEENGKGLRVGNCTCSTCDGHVCMCVCSRVCALDCFQTSSTMLFSGGVSHSHEVH